MAHFKINSTARLGIITAALAIGLAGAAWAQPKEADTLTPEQEKAEANKILPEIGKSAKPRAVAQPQAPKAAAAESTPAAPAEKTTQTIVLLGERASLTDSSSGKGPFVDLLGLTTATLGGKVIDRTTHSQVLHETVQAAEQVKALKPDVVLVFTGLADEKAKTSSEMMRAESAKLLNILKATGARVVLLPASPNVGAMTGAYLRITASDLGAAYVSMGTEVSGRPYEEAFDGIRAELTGESAEPKPVVTAAETPAVKIQEPETAPAPNISVASEKARLENELSRVAGQSDAAPSREELNSTLTGQTASSPAAPDDALTSVSAGGVVTKRGKDAQESISMRPLPAVKAFRPSIPVPRLNIEKKEPGLSR